MTKTYLTEVVLKFSVLKQLMMFQFRLNPDDVNDSAVVQLVLDPAVSTWLPWHHGSWHRSTAEVEVQECALGKYTQTRATQLLTLLKW